MATWETDPAYESQRRLPMAGWETTEMTTLTKTTQTKTMQECRPYDCCVDSQDRR